MELGKNVVVDDDKNICELPAFIWKRKAIRW